MQYFGVTIQDMQPESAARKWNTKYTILDRKHGGSSLITVHYGDGNDGDGNNEKDEGLS